MDGIGAIGVIGLGHMGAPMAARLGAAFPPVLAFDMRVDDIEAIPGVVFARSVDDMAARTRTIVLSLPDAKVVESVTTAIATAPSRTTANIVDCSTIGVAAATRIDTALAAHDITYVDAAVSGGVAGATNGTLTVMCACPREVFQLVEPVLSTFASHVHHVAVQPGLGQAAKIANNFLSATALAATSEVVHFATTLGIDPACLLDVVNTSSGRNTATSEKFPKHILTGLYAAGFSNSMMRKDVSLYRASAATAGIDTALGRAVEHTWRDFADDDPGADITRLHPYLRTTLHGQEHLQ